MTNCNLLPPTTVFLVVKLCSVKHLLKPHPDLHLLLVGKPLYGGQQAEQEQFIFISEAAAGVCRTLLNLCARLSFRFKRGFNDLMAAWTGVSRRINSIDNWQEVELLLLDSVLLFLQVMCSSSKLCGIKQRG